MSNRKDIRSSSRACLGAGAAAALQRGAEAVLGSEADGFRKTQSCDIVKILGNAPFQIYVCVCKAFT